jgi:hypothetical protein
MKLVLMRSGRVTPGRYHPNGPPAVVAGHTLKRHTGDSLVTGVCNIEQPRRIEMLLLPPILATQHFEPEAP